MYDAPGIGLAAPQIGVPRRLIVMDPAKDEAPKTPVIMVNPEILERSDELRVHEEGCLSIPDYTAEIERPAKTRVAYIDREGRQAGDRAAGHLVDAGAARDRPSERRSIHRLSVAAEARHGGAKIHQAETHGGAIAMLLIASIVLEVAVAVVAMLAAVKGRPYLYGLALTFTIYVLYDLGRAARLERRKGHPVGAVSVGERERVCLRFGAFTATSDNARFTPLGDIRADAPMRIVFMGTPDFAVPSLRAIVEAGHEVVAVYTQPPRQPGAAWRCAHRRCSRRPSERASPCLRPAGLKAPRSRSASLRSAPMPRWSWPMGMILPKPILDAHAPWRLQLARLAPAALAGRRAHQPRHHGRRPRKRRLDHAARPRASTRARSAWKRASRSAPT